MPSEVAAKETTPVAPANTPAPEAARPDTMINDKPIHDGPVSPTTPEGEVKPTETVEKIAPEAPKVAEAKAEAEAKKVEAAKEDAKYDLKLPEGSLLGPEHTEKVADFARRRGFSNEQAQAILERESEILNTYTQSQIHGLRQKSEEWVAQVKEDKEIGGEAFTKNVELANRVVHRFGSDQLRKTLSESGLGNHPELVRIFAKIGQAMAPDQLVMPGTQPRRALSLEERLYPNHKPKSEE